MTPTGLPPAARPANLRDIALVLAAHGDRGADRSNAWLRAHESALKQRGAFARVAMGLLKGEPAIEAALGHAAQAGAGRVMIYPVFIGDGYFLRALRDRIAATGLKHAPEILEPFGADPGLPSLMLERALDAAREAGFEPKETRLLVIGHGSQVSRANAQATQRLIETLQRTHAFGRVEPGFIEEPPLLADALAAGTGPTVVAGYLTGEGMHAQDDVPRAIAASGARAVYTGAIGADPAVPDMILAAVAGANGQ